MNAHRSVVIDDTIEANTRAYHNRNQWLLFRRANLFIWLEQVPKFSIGKFQPVAKGFSSSMIENLGLLDLELVIGG